MLLTGALGIKYLSDIFLDGVEISPSLYVLDQKDKWNIPYTLGIQPYCFKKKAKFIYEIEYVFNVKAVLFT